jgi:hypothetical protein
MKLFVVASRENHFSTDDFFFKEKFIIMANKQ